MSSILTSSTIFPRFFRFLGGEIEPPEKPHTENNGTLSSKLAQERVWSFRPFAAVLPKLYYCAAHSPKTAIQVECINHCFNNVT